MPVDRNRLYPVNTREWSSARMKMKFWGARGSHPTPLLPHEVQNKISSVVQRIKPADLESPETRERFLAGLPGWLFGTIGGNTPCVEVLLSSRKRLILDGGSGIEELSRSMQRELRKPAEYHIFFSHFHYDHIQGLPFFSPAYDPAASVHFYSPAKNFEEIIRDQMRAPYFPITMSGKMSEHITFTVLNQMPVSIGGASIKWRPLNHPQGAYAYRIEEKGRVLIHATDVELVEADFEKTDANRTFFENANVLVLDTQYTLGEAIEKYNWGHSSFSLGVDFAHAWNISRLYLFHHEPLYNDQKLYGNLQSARWYANRLGKASLEVYLSEEGNEVEI